MKKIAVLLIFLASSLGIFAQKNNYYHRPTGYKAFGDLDVNVDFKDGKREDLFLGIYTSHGYQFNPFFFLGGGVGIEVENKKNCDSQTYVPFFGQGRVNILDRKISPFVDFKGGYAFADEEGGFIQPAVGVSFAIGYRFAINVALEYTRNFIHQDNGDRKIKGDRLALNFGFEF